MAKQIATYSFTNAGSLSGLPRESKITTSNGLCIYDHKFSYDEKGTLIRDMNWLTKRDISSEFDDQGRLLKCEWAGLTVYQAEFHNGNMVKETTQNATTIFSEFDGKIIAKSLSKDGFNTIKTFDRTGKLVSIIINKCTQSQ
jgi:hypothetical protein